MTQALTAKQSDDPETSDKNALEKWRHLFADELKEVDNVIINYTQCETTLISELVQHIVSSGGKRLRPILTIISSKLCGYEGDRHINLAACIEFLHTATLLHDDVVDESELRRGSPSANNLWGNSSSILVGDFLLSRSFQIMARDGCLKILKVLSDTSAIITEGEVKQLVSANDINITRETYIDIVSSKTAQLFSAACQVGAILGESDEEKLAAFGLNLGIAFQIIDDALDYLAEQKNLGKVIGDDFREQKVTLPVIIAYQHSNEEEKTFWQNVIEEEQQDGDLQKAIAILNKYNVLDEVMNQAKEYVDIAKDSINTFDDCPERQALLDLLDFSVSRLY